jgi:hypothetical protein
VLVEVTFALAAGCTAKTSPASSSSSAPASPMVPPRWPVPTGKQPLPPFALASGERRMLQLVASIAGGVPVSLYDALPGIDRRNASLVIKAIAHATAHIGIQLDAYHGRRSRGRSAVAGRDARGSSAGLPARTWPGARAPMIRNRCSRRAPARAGGPLARRTTLALPRRTRSSMLLRSPRASPSTTSTPSGAIAGRSTSRPRRPGPGRSAP